MAERYENNSTDSFSFLGIPLLTDPDKLNSPDNRQVGTSSAPYFQNVLKAKNQPEFKDEASDENKS